MQHGFGGPEVPVRRLLLVDQLEQLRGTPLVTQVDRAGWIHDRMRVFTVALVFRYCCEIAPVLPDGAEFLVPQLQVLAVIGLVEREYVQVGVIQDRARYAASRNIVHDLRRSGLVVLQHLVCEQKRVVVLKYVEQEYLIIQRSDIEVFVVDCRGLAVEDGEGFHVLPVGFGIADVAVVVLEQYVIKTVPAQLCVEVLVHVPGNDGGVAPDAAPVKGAAAKVLPRITVEIPDLPVGLPEYIVPVMEIVHD